MPTKAKYNVTYEFDLPSGPPMWPWGKLQWSDIHDECEYAFQDVHLPNDIFVKACYDALIEGGPLACKDFDPEIRGLLAVLLQAAANEASERCEYEPRVCLDALMGAAEDRSFLSGEDEETSDD